MDLAAMWAAVGGAVGNALIGTGILVVNGQMVCLLKGVDYQSDGVKLHEQILGALVGQVAFRRVLDAGASLKAQYVDVLGNIQLFTINSTSCPPDGVLPVYAATYYGYDGITIVFSACNIIPSGAKMVQGKWCEANLEIKSVGALPTITGGSAGLAVTTTITDVAAGSTTTIPIGQTATGRDGVISIEGVLDIQGILSL